MRVLVSGLLLLLSGSTLGKTLKFEDIQHAQITLVEGVSSLYLHKDTLLETGHYEDFFIEARYRNEKGALPFGTLKNETDFTERIKLPEKGYWRGVVPYDNFLLVLEGQEMKVTLRLKNGEYSLYNNVIVDLFTPADDSRGRPTRWEMDSSRRSFSRNLKRYEKGHVILTGLSPKPSGWPGRADRFFVLTNIKGFPLFEMACENEDGIVCKLEKQCFVGGIKDGDELSGIGVSAKRRQILIASQRFNKIYILRYKSCYEVTKVGELALPKKLRTINSVHVDHEDNLWVSTNFPDDYLNASVYKWPSEAW